MTTPASHAIKDSSRPVTARFMTRPLERTTLIHPITWFWARQCGGLDGITGVPLIADEADLSDAPERGMQAPAALMTEFIRGIIHAFNERDEREFNAALTSIATDVQALRTLHDQIQSVDRKLDGARAEARVRQDEPRLTAADVVRGPAEKDAPEAVVIARRQKSKDVLAAAGQAKVAALENERASLLTAYSTYVHGVTVVFENYVTRTGRARAYSERVCAIYRRRVILHHLQGVLLQRLWADTTCVPTPARTLGACPWVPTESNKEMTTNV